MDTVKLRVILRSIFSLYSGLARCVGQSADDDAFSTLPVKLSDEHSVSSFSFVAGNRIWSIVGLVTPVDVVFVVINAAKSSHEATVHVDLLGITLDLYQV